MNVFRKRGPSGAIATCPFIRHKTARMYVGLPSQEEQAAYYEAVKRVDWASVKRDIKRLFRTSHDWWPADYGHYGPFFIRMAWHATGTYRMR